LLGATALIERVACRLAKSKVPKNACKHLFGFSESSARLGMKGLDL